MEFLRQIYKLYGALSFLPSSFLILYFRNGFIDTLASQPDEDPQKIPFNSKAHVVKNLLYFYYRIDFARER